LQFLWFYGLFALLVVVELYVRQETGVLQELCNQKLLPAQVLLTGNSKVSVMQVSNMDKHG
jgi:hypothetical protein